MTLEAGVAPSLWLLRLSRKQVSKGTRMICSAMCGVRPGRPKGVFLYGGLVDGEASVVDVWLYSIKYSTLFMEGR